MTEPDASDVHLAEPRVCEPRVFDEDFATALVLVAHPDDAEYGLAAAVAKWTALGKRVVYGLASAGEAGIAGMTPGTAGPVRVEEQRRGAAVVGVDEVQFWGFADSAISDGPELRARVAAAIEEFRPGVVLTLYGGAEWRPGAPNQRDHIEFAEAVRRACVTAGVPAFETSPDPTLVVDVSGYIERAVESLAEHRRYLSVLKPHTPVIEQARQQVRSATGPAGGFAHAVGLSELTA